MLSNKKLNHWTSASATPQNCSIFRLFDVPYSLSIFKQNDSLFEYSIVVGCRPAEVVNSAPHEHRHCNQEIYGKEAFWIKGLSTWEIQGSHICTRLFHFVGTVKSRWRLIIIIVIPPLFKVRKDNTPILI